MLLVGRVRVLLVGMNATGRQGESVTGRYECYW